MVWFWVRLALAGQPSGGREPQLVLWGAGSALAVGGAVALSVDHSDRAPLPAGLALYGGATVAIAATAIDSGWFARRGRDGPKVVWLSGLGLLAAGGVMEAAAGIVGLASAVNCIGNVFTQCPGESPVHRSLEVASTALVGSGLALTLVGEPVLGAFTHVTVTPELQPGGGSLVFSTRF